ncbi:ATP-binding protein [Actinokineospora soli]|uniref:ATP-binding protein n=1 Tax=Actinokineospora soli TaxID=1048753 RepID=A0ABW2TKP6_9PSEU
MVGRDAELAELTAVWRRARAGSGGVVVISGEGGIGKTRLAEELLRATGALTGVGVATGPVPYGVWAEALGDVVAARPAVLERDRPWPAELARVVPAVEGAPRGPGRTASGCSSPSWSCWPAPGRSRCSSRTCTWPTRRAWS